MIYNKQLPHLHQLLHLAQRTAFPINNGQLITQAEDTGEPAEIIEFLRYMPNHEIFTSRAEFMTHCEEIELLINRDLSQLDERE